MIVECAGYQNIPITVVLGAINEYPITNNEAYERTTGTQTRKIGHWDLHEGQILV